MGQTVHCRHWAAAAALLLAPAAATGAPPEDARSWDARLRGKRFSSIHGEASQWRDTLFLCRDGVAYGRWKADVEAKRLPPGADGDDLAEWAVREYEGKACLWIAVHEPGEEAETGCSELGLEGDALLVDDDRWTKDGDAGC